MTERGHEMTPDTGPRAVDFGDLEINRLWDEAVQQRLGLAGSVLIRTVMPDMQRRLAEAREQGAREERARWESLVKQHPLARGETLLALAADRLAEALSVFEDER